MPRLELCSVSLGIPGYLILGFLGTGKGAVFHVIEHLPHNGFFKLLLIIMIHFGCNIQVERYLKATQNSVEYSDFLQWIRNCGDVEKGSKNTRTILRCFFFKMTELRMKNLAPGFADMSNSFHDLMWYKLSAKFNVSSRRFKLLSSVE